MFTLLAATLCHIHTKLNKTEEILLLHFGDRKLNNILYTVNYNAVCNKIRLCLCYTANHTGVAQKDAIFLEELLIGQQ